MEISDLRYYFPKNVLSNDDLSKIFKGWDKEDFFKKVGIKNRFIASDNETALDLGYNAANKLLKSNQNENIDMLLLCTQSPDYFLPTSACVLQDRLGLSSNCAAFDFNLGCSGFVYGLAIAKGFLMSNIQSVLLITADTYSKHIYSKDLSNRSIFGDAAAATLITNNTKEIKIGEFVMGSDGGGKDNLIVHNGAFRNQFSDIKEIEYGSHSKFTKSNLFMNGPEIFRFTIEKIPKLFKSVLEKNNISVENIDYFIFHQANKFILNHIRQKLDIPEEKFHNDVTNYGNTVSSTIPIALKDCIEKKIVVNGDKVMLLGFGVGYSWAGTVITI